LPEVALYYPFMTVEEILRLYGKLQGIGKKEMKESLPRLVSTVGLAGFEKLRLRNFSKGMLQRVGLAQAIMGDPELLILDEVTSGLDPVGRRDLRNILIEFRNRGKTVFFSSHELSEVARLCDRIILVDEGKVIQEHSLQDILDSQRRYRVRVNASGPLPELPALVQVNKDGETAFELETGSKELQQTLLQELSQSGVQILGVESEQGSLEDYFVEVVGHKVT
jgi:ABC-2 type transport system ATP-binding protein